jgi:hypothetical protein
MNIFNFLCVLFIKVDNLKLAIYGYKWHMLIHCFLKFFVFILVQKIRVLFFEVKALLSGKGQTPDPAVLKNDVFLLNVEDTAGVVLIEAL